MSPRRSRRAPVRLQVEQLESRLTPSTGQTVSLPFSDNFDYSSSQWGPFGSANWTKQAAGDFTGDGKTDVALFNATDNAWYVGTSTGSGLAVSRWGAFGSANWTRQAVGDFSGDGKTDVALFNVNDNSWYVGVSTGTGFTVSRWGPFGSAAWTAQLVGDFTGDGKADVALFNANDNSWYVGVAAGSGFNVTRWGSFGSAAWTAQVVGDFNGDGKADVGMFNANDNAWYVGLSTGPGFNVTRWGPFGSANWTNQVVGDFAGDGKADLAMFNANDGGWYVGTSSGSGFTVSLWGRLPAGSGWTTQVAGDFTGDGKADLASFNPATGTWWVSASTGSGFTTTPWVQLPAASGYGAQVAGDFNGDGKAEIANYYPGTASWWVPLSTGSSFKLLSSAGLGAAWTTDAGSFSAQNGQALSGSALVNVATLNGVTQTNAAAEEQVSLPATGTAEAGLVARYAGPGANNLYAGVLAGENGVYSAQIWRCLGGAWTELSYDYVPTATGTLAFQASGSSLALFLNGQQVSSATDNAITGAGSAGILETAGALVDNFSARPGAYWGATGTGPTYTRTITVSTSAALQSALNSATAGTRILLQPGTYQGGLFGGSNLQGTASSPILIAAADPNNRPIISGGASGLGFSQIAYVTLQNLVIQGCTTNGINIDDGGNVSTPSHHVILSGLTVQNVGTTGIQNGIKLSGVNQFVVQGCTVQTWGQQGAAINMVGCHQGTVTSSSFQFQDYAGSEGVQAKGGSSNIIIRNNFLNNAGTRAIQVGGNTDAQFFRPQPPPGYEAANVIAEGNVIVGSDAAVVFSSQVGSVARFNTIYDPQQWAIRILEEDTLGGMVPSQNGVFANNIVVFQSGQMTTAVNVGAGTAPQTFTFAGNWWYCGNNPSQSRPSLPAGETGGTYGVDPQLVDPAGNDFQPRAGSPAAGVGAYAALV